MCIANNDDFLWRETLVAEFANKEDPRITILMFSVRETWYVLMPRLTPMYTGKI